MTSYDFTFAKTVEALLKDFTVKNHIYTISSPAAIQDVNGKWSYSYSLQGTSDEQPEIVVSNIPLMRELLQSFLDKNADFKANGALTTMTLIKILISPTNIITKWQIAVKKLVTPFEGSEGITGPLSALSIRDSTAL